jgi:hypothetical protein
MNYTGYLLVTLLPVVIVAFIFGKSRLTGEHFKIIIGLAILMLLGGGLWLNWIAFQGVITYNWDLAKPISFMAMNKEWKLPVQQYAWLPGAVLAVALVANRFLPKEGEHR